MRRAVPVVAVPVVVAVRSAVVPVAAAVRRAVPVVAVPVVVAVRLAAEVAWLELPPMLVVAPL